MRIVVVNNFYPPRVGGSAHLSDALARGYARHGHEVLVVTAAYGEAPSEERREGVRIVRLSSFTLPDRGGSLAFDLSFASRPSLPRRLGKLLDEFAPDVIHQHGQFMDLTWSTGRYARRRGIPALLSVHTRLENPTARYRGLLRLLDATLVAPRLRLNRPTQVVMDVYMRDYIVNRYRRGYEALVAIPVGVDPDWVRGGSAEAGRRLIGVDAGVPILLSIGHVIPLRDRVGIVRALPSILDRHPEARLVIVGQVYYDHFRTVARQLGVEHAVISLGAVPKRAIPDLLAAADLETHEQGGGLGTATLEAMAAGVPVVGWGRHDNFPNVRLVERRDVFLCEPGDVQGLADRCVAVLDDPGSAAQIGRAASLVVDEHFAFEDVLARHLEVLRALIARPRPHPRRRRSTLRHDHQEART